MIRSYQTTYKKDFREMDAESFCKGRPCPKCDEGPMRPEHAHYVCDECGYRGACCW